MLYFISVFFMALSAQGHEVFYIIFCFTAAHTPCVNVVDVCCLSFAYFAWYKGGGIVTKVFQVQSCVFLHSYFRAYFIKNMRHEIVTINSVTISGATLSIWFRITGDSMVMVISPQMLPVTAMQRSSKSLWYRLFTMCWYFWR